MARTLKEKTINGKKYTVVHLSTTPALNLLLDLVRMLGPGLAPIASNLGQLRKLLDRDVDDLKVDFLGEAVRALVSGVDKATTHEIMKTLAGVTTVEGVGRLDNAYELHFAQEGLGVLFQWAFFALQTQYDDFSDAFVSMMQTASRQAPKA